jgi:hypothetical protein
MDQEITPFRHRHDGWTADRQVLFLERLAETGSVRAACEGAGLTNTSAYRAYRRMPEFARAWDEALAARRPMLEEAAFERALHGVTVPITRQGEVVGERRQFSDGLLRYMIERGDKVAAQEAEAAREERVLAMRAAPACTQEELDEALMERLDELAWVRRDAKAREWRTAVAHVERLRAEGVADMDDRPPPGWMPEKPTGTRPVVIEGDWD